MPPREGRPCVPAPRSRHARPRPSIGAAAGAQPPRPRRSQPRARRPSARSKKILSLAAVQGSRPASEPCATADQVPPPPTSVIDRCCRGKVGPASPRRNHATVDLGHRSERRRPCRRLTPADRRLVPDVLRSSLEIGSVQGSPRNRPSERGGRRMLISPSSKFGSLLRGLHDPAGSSSSTTERGK